MVKKKSKKKMSLNKNIVLFCIFCWVVPIVIIYIAMTISYKGNIDDKMKSMFIEKLRSADVFISNYLDEAIDSARKPSYESYLEEAWNNYNKDGMRNECYQIITSNLRNKFYWDKRFDICAFYIEGQQEPFTYLSSNSYPLGSFIEKIDRRIQEIRDIDSSYAQVIIEDERIFIVRNVYTTSNYEKFGTLVLEINKKNLFSDIIVEDGQSMALCINDSDSIIAKDEFYDDARKIKVVEQVLERYSVEDKNIVTINKGNNYIGYLLEAKHEEYHLGILLTVDKAILNAEVNRLYGMIILLLLITGPVLVIIAYFLKKQITQPISKLVKASKEMESGKLGVTISGKEMPNKEFKYLQHSFNKMSKQVEYLFNYAYDEKLARKDAKILALQAQINPHFLNNTLEIMNWQARMSGDITLSKMIESLGTVLDYHMDREDKRLIRLSEELRCADAYLCAQHGQQLDGESPLWAW